MKRVFWIALAATVALLAGLVGGSISQVVINQRPLSALGLSAGVGYGTTTPTTANSGSPPFDGEVFLVRNVGTADPRLNVFSTFSNGWMAPLMAGGASGSPAELDVIANGPVRLNVAHETFDNVVAHFTEEDFTASVVTDGGENVIMLSNSQLGAIAWRPEAPGGPGLAETLAPFDTKGVLDLETFVDDADNEGVVLVFGAYGPDQVAGVHDAVWFDEDDGTTSYCEASIDIVDISDADDYWFGWIVKEAYDDPPASATYDTSALFVISDNAGDLDIETQLNGGGLLNDDTGVTWADLATHILRVTISADSVSFTLDGAAVTQVNAVLNADNGDEAVCVFGFTNAAAGDPNVTIEYVEIGRNQ